MKNYLVIGGTTGIGWAITKQLLAGNNRVHVASRNLRGLPEIEGLQWHPLDISVEMPDFPVVGEPLHGLVYAPGTLNLKPFRNLKPTEFNYDWNINVLGAVKAIQHYMNILKAAGNSSVVLFSSVVVQTGMKFHASQAASKGAIEGLTRSLAAEFAPFIRVNAIAPSLITTPLTERLLNSEEKKTAALERHPLKRIGKPEDAASLATWLLSDEGSWATGQIFRIDGGMSGIQA